MTIVKTVDQAMRFFIRQPSVQLLVFAWAATAAALLHAGPLPGAAWLAPVAVLLFWPFNEWLIHVFVLHAKPIQVAGRSIDLPVARKHRAHHRDPRNLEILFIPLGSFLFSLPFAALLCFSLAPSAAIALASLLSIITLGLHYEWIHFLAHTQFTPRNRIYGEVIRRHRLHHYKNEKQWFGVSVLGADQILGTSPDPDDVPRSATARRLHEEPDTPIEAALP